MFSKNIEVCIGVFMLIFLNPYDTKKQDLFA
jgi:hypothetical protein